MLAGAQGVFAEIGTGTIGFARQPAAQCQSVAFAGEQVGNHVVGPQLLRVHRREAHFFVTGALPAFADGLVDEGRFVQALDGSALLRRRRQSQSKFFFQDQGKGSPLMHAGAAADAAA